MKKTFKKLKGFGVIETLIACAIIIIICGALLAINVIITRDISFARGRAVAYNLAQEAIESTRQIRDSNLVDSKQETNWDTFVCNQGATPVLSRPLISDATTKRLYIISAGSAPVCYGSTPRLTLTPDASDSGEDIQIGTNTYNRKIHFLASGVSPKLPVANTNVVTEENAIRVVVEISWNDRGSNRQIEIAELLTNWKRGF